MHTDTRRLMKADEMRGLGSKVIFNFDDLNRRCEEQIQKVRDKAEEILREAEQKALQIQEQAKKSGYDAGYQSGIAKAEQDLTSRVSQQARSQFEQGFQATLPVLGKVADSLNQERDEWLNHWEGTALKLSLAIAAKILHRQIDAQPDLLAGMMRETLRLASGSSQVTLRMNPVDHELLAERMGDIIGVLGKVGTVHVEPDANVTRGGCLIQTRHGQIDAQIETQLSRIADELTH